MHRRSSYRLHIGLVLSLIGLALAATLGFHRSVTAQSSRDRFEQDVSQIFSSHEDVRLDPATTLERVRESGRLSLQTTAHDFEIEVQPNDLRAPNYTAQAIGDDGVAHELLRGPVTTYKGVVLGMPGTDARFSFAGDHLEGMILTDGEPYFVEPAQKYSASADPSDYVLYKATDLRPEAPRLCGITLEEEVAKNSGGFMNSDTAGTPAAVFSPNKVVELATEADFEYVQALGSASNANNDILSIMNSVQAIYQRDIGVTFTIVFQNAWDTPNDPYSANDAQSILNEFQSYWNANFANHPRDLAHLWTARSAGGVAGFSFQGSVCQANGTFSYGFSTFQSAAPFRVGIPAHEIGHNFNASHCDGQSGCDGTIMISLMTQSSSLVFCPFSINEITNYINANGSCLNTVTAPNPIDDPTFFVKQHYLDFLNRQPDSGGLNFWASGITSCGSDANCIANKRVDTSAAFFLSIEFQQTGYEVERTYKTAFGDTQGTSSISGQLSVPIVRFQPDFLNDIAAIGANLVVGQGDWQTTLENNKKAYFSNFVTRSSFTSKYPSTMLPTDYVHTLNQNAGSPLSSTDEVALSAQLATGQKNRADVLRQITESQNLVNAEFNRAFVLMQYFGYLRRNPNDKPDSDYSGYDFWLRKLNGFGDYKTAEMVKAFITSTEYRARFGTP